MTTVTHRWALLVATQHGKAAATGMTAETRRQEMAQLLARAKSVATPLRTVALITDRFEQEWRDTAGDLPPYNLMIDRASDSPLVAIEHALLAIRAREGGCSVILIPADHCAAVESSWVIGARNALGLAADHRDTVYLLQDKPQDPLPFDASSDMCSSTVIVGSTDSLLELCRGTRPTRLIELSTYDLPDADEIVTAAQDATSESPIRIVRIQSVEEYARLQRGQYTKAPAFIDVHA